jgi:ADP-ribosylglycohydrolase
MGKTILGAAIGDIVGSEWEFSDVKPSYEERLFSSRSSFTDDTVMTAAIAQWLKDGHKEKPADVMRRFGRLYPGRGYGGKFHRWIYDDSMGPYWSWGNGSAMRVSAVAHYASSGKRCIELAEQTARVSHDHPEGILGAVVTAYCCYIGLHSDTPQTALSRIQDYALDKYPKIAWMRLAELHREYEFTERCSETVPQAIYCVLCSDSFEDCIRKARWIGGDSDTLCAIAGSIAECVWGIPDDLKEEALKRLDDRIIGALTI